MSFTLNAEVPSPTSSSDDAAVAERRSDTQSASTDTRNSCDSGTSLSPKGSRARNALIRGLRSFGRFRSFEPFGSRGLRKIVIGGLLPVFLLLLWAWITAKGVVPAYRLPSPTAVWKAAVGLHERGLLGQYVAISTQRVLIGFGIGAAIGFVLGAIVGVSRWTENLLSPSLDALRAVPSLAWVPLLVLWVGINEDSKIALIAIGAFFPVYTTVAGALRHVDSQLIEAGRAYGLQGARLLAQIQLPAIIPSVLSGLRLALAQSWLFLVAAELLNSSMGLGFLLVDSGQNGRVDRMFLAIILLALLGLLTNLLVSILERLLLWKWF